jgi:peptidyl-prolyl cis-trans isomerase D
MTVLGLIRKRGAIIVVVVGLALFAFVVGDFVPGMGGSRSLDVAKIGGKTVSLPEFSEKVEEMTRRYQQQFGHLDNQLTDMAHDQAWNTLVNETLMQQAYERLGLKVSSEELWDVITGFNPPAIIRQSFSDQQTGAFNRAGLIEFLRFKDSDPQAAAEWAMVERFVLEDILIQKYNAIVGRGLFVPDFVAQNENLENGKQVDFDFIVQSHFSINDSLINVSSKDIKDFYNKHKSRWEQQASRDIEFVVFNITPSIDDHIAAQQWIERILPAFEEAEDPFQFIHLNTIATADRRFMTAEELPLQLVELFEQPIGSMVGPYQDGESWKISRLVKSEARPDSIRMRQIVIEPSERTQIAYLMANTLADSIKTALDGGADFSTLALKYSADPNVMTNSGDIGWVHESRLQGTVMEPAFELARNEVLLAQAGQHIFVAQVTERGVGEKKVQIATLQHDIRASDRTIQMIFSQASKFAMENRSERQFDETAAAQNLVKRVASNIGENDRNLPALPSARSVIRWAFEAKRGEVSDVFSIDDMYVVAILKNARKKGNASLKDVTEQISFEVRLEKKAEIIAAQLSEAAKNAQTFSELAFSLNLPVQSAPAVTFASFSVPGAGIEPQLIGASFASAEGTISKPVNGVNGVYLFNVTQINEPDDIAIEMARERLRMTLNNRSASEPLQAIRNATKIEDMRSKFY